ncbi:MAG TPA: flagellar hook-associated protein FlgK [Gammaproteobacteria bacterium]|nr:flagellar hook-associated protein FlgK [Gammaproteobacteria bacterium]HRP86774.1 flagellar hook-associated protein FlgK [Gammaproteobacteria bacterium]
MSGVFGIGTSALLAYQRALSVTGQNIANVGNENYSRQRIDLAVRNPQFSGAGWYGQGVDVVGVQRIADQFVQRQVLDNTAGSARQQVYYQYAQRADNLLADAEAGLAPVLQQFFAAVQDVANDPTSTAARQVLLSQGEALADRFAFLQRRLDDQRQVVEGQIGAAVDEINGLAAGIASLNQKIAEGIGQSGGAMPNDLLDQRDAMIERLSGLVAVQTLPQGDGTLNVMIGNGQNLVMGSTATVLTAQPLGADPSRTEIAVVNPGSTVGITDIISGGELGALLDVRRELLDPVQNALGRTAVGLALSFNELHRQGVDLDGVAGGDFFQLPQGEVLVGRGNTATGQPALTFTDAAALTAGDYRVSFDGVEWRLTRTGSATPLATAAPGGTLAADGFELDLSGIAGATAGDSFDVRPTRTAAAGLGVAITDPRAFAAALPPAAPGESVVGDNRNALALAGLASERVLANGTTSIAASYNELVANVGVKTRQAQLSAEAQGRMLEASRAQRESISGVNLDEEASNLLRYQQAYAAAAQVIATAGTMFDTLLMAVRR